MTPVSMCFLIAGIVFFIGAAFATDHSLAMFTGCMGLGFANIGFSQL